MKTFSIEELTAYLDGELDEQRAAEITAAIKVDPNLAKGLEDVDFDTAALREQADLALQQAPAAPVLILRPAARFKPFAAAMAGFAIGVLGMWLTQNTVKPSWRDYAASYHALYVNETLADVTETTWQADDRLRLNAKRLGMVISSGQIDVVEGLTLKRSQLLGFEGQPLLQVAYIADTGTPFALCIMKSSVHDNVSLGSSTMQGMASASWTKDGFQYLLIGGVDSHAINSAAKAFYKLL